ncbi:integrase catalytic domain-containing protein [Nephila pilipes]|uniref:Integrase catalytic domain-containing protein n=1 Tax=Nephila pilipes TaxID=299642 RepID=A0A8X6PLT9_NEPPI|nr:integrase catalytic domain-containing protein [Nephila pilipes]
MLNKFYYVNDLFYVWHFVEEAYKSSSKAVKIMKEDCYGVLKRAPLKELTLPKLELMAALIASTLEKKLTKLFPKIRKVFLWSNSIVVLHWFKGSAHNWKPFVAIRVTEIQRHTDPLDWRHCDEKINPADLITRGCHAEELLNSTKWFYGPLFLSLPDGKWPISKLPSSKAVESQNERRSKIEVSLHCATQRNKNGRESLLKFEDFSSREGPRRLTDSNDFAEMSGKSKDHDSR